jgi:hypothetical protein
VILPPLSPLRPSDLAHTQHAVLGYAEQALAHDRLPADRSRPVAGGLIIDQVNAVRKWRGPLNHTPEHCHLADLLELDHFGVTALWNRKIGNIPEASYLAICPWDSVPTVATYLRTHCLAQAMHPQTAQAMHLAEADARLGIPERSPNDGRLPSYSRIRPGPLWRLDSASAENFRHYFNLADPAHQPELCTTELGGNSYLIYAAVNNPEEPLRAIMVTKLFLPVAEKELNRWIKTANHQTTIPR